MKTKIWFLSQWIKAGLKEVIGLNLSPWETFILEIGS